MGQPGHRARSPAKNLIETKWRSGTKGGCEPGNSISRFLCIKHYPASATPDVGACSGAECRKDLPPSGQGEIFFLDIPFHRTP